MNATLRRETDRKPCRGCWKNRGSDTGCSSLLTLSLGARTQRRLVPRVKSCPSHCALPARTISTSHATPLHMREISFHTVNHPSSFRDTVRIAFKPLFRPHPGPKTRPRIRSMVYIPPSSCASPRSCFHPREKAKKKTKKGNKKKKLVKKVEGGCRTSLLSVENLAPDHVQLFSGWVTLEMGGSTRYPLCHIFASYMMILFRYGTRTSEHVCTRVHVGGQSSTDAMRRPHVDQSLSASGPAKMSFS